jgi:ankyrin repeat protein
MPTHRARAKQWLEAALIGNVTALHALLDEGNDIHVAGADGRTALMQAAGGHHHRAIALLLTRGARADARANNGHTALRYAVAPDYANLFRRNASSALAETLTLLLQHNAPIEAFDLMLVATYHEPDTATLFRARLFARPDQSAKLLREAKNLIDGEHEYQRNEIVARLTAMEALTRRADD